MVDRLRSKTAGRGCPLPGARRYSPPIRPVAPEHFLQALHAYRRGQDGRAAARRYRRKRGFPGKASGPWLRARTLRDRHPAATPGGRPSTSPGSSLTRRLRARPVLVPDQPRLDHRSSTCRITRYTAEVQTHPCNLHTENAEYSGRSSPARGVPVDPRTRWSSSPTEQAHQIFLEPKGGTHSKLLQRISATSPDVQDAVRDDPRPRAQPRSLRLWLPPSGTSPRRPVARRRSRPRPCTTSSSPADRRDDRLRGSRRPGPVAGSPPLPLGRRILRASSRPLARLHRRPDRDLVARGVEALPDVHQPCRVPPAAPE